MAKKIGTVTYNWNREKFLVPHLRMMTGVDRKIVLQGTNFWKGYESRESEDPDLSEKSVKKFLPKVEIFEACVNEFNHQLHNQSLDILNDCDIIMKIDSDIFFTQKDWKKLINFIRNTDYHCYRLHYDKMSVQYHKDYLHGKMDDGGVEIIGSSPLFKWYGIGDYPSDVAVRRYEIDDWKNFKAHHFRSAYKEGIDGKINQLEKYITCPKEIRASLDEWWIQLDKWKNELKEQDIKPIL